MAEADLNQNLMLEHFIKLKEDFEYFAPRCLVIRTKDEGNQPFALNEAQAHIHEIAEQQLAEEGRVRVILLKGRQQGMCLDPDTRVLTADMRWIPLREVTVGQELVATDEKNYGKPRGRRLRRTVVEAIAHTIQNAYRLHLEDGRTVVCSGNHRWLTRKSQTQWKWRKIEDGKGRIEVGTRIRSITTPWDDPEYEDGWFGGMIDGEGSLDHNGRLGTRLAVTQRYGAVFGRMKQYLADRHIRFSILEDTRKPVASVAVYNVADTMRIFGMSRPSRFVNGDWWENKALGNGGDIRVTKIEPLGPMRLIDLQTQRKTFIAEGFVSHNSTYIEGRFYWKVIHAKGLRAFILTHEGMATANLFEMASRYHENCPSELRPSTDRDSGKELHFDLLDSGYKVGTAGSKGTGRSATFQLFHGSEVAFWPNAEEHTTGAMQAVPETSGEIWLESTSDGMGNFFYAHWVKAVAGLNGYIPVFIPWYWQSEYELPYEGEALDSSGDPDSPDEQELYDRYGPGGWDADPNPERQLKLENLMWRRQKIATLPDGIAQFKREYPNNAQEAFENAGYKQLIPAMHVGRAIANGARVNERGEHLNSQGGVIEGRGPMILGVDPARFGDDRLAIALRQGRVSHDISTFNAKMDQMEIVGVVKGLLDSLPIDACFIDEGMGVGVIDRLHEMGYHEVEGVNFGAGAWNQQKYTNRRNEMWQEMAEWFSDPNVVLFNNTAEDRHKKAEEATLDLCAVEYKFNSRNLKELESKDDTKKRLGLSPDMGDALALTFARPVAYSTPPLDEDPHTGRDTITGY